MKKTEEESNKKKQKTMKGQHVSKLFFLIKFYIISFTITFIQSGTPTYDKYQGS